MAQEILFKKSPNELQKEIQQLAAQDQRVLHPRAKEFSAIAKLQGFDVLPDTGTVAEVNAAIAAGGIEIQRGLAATKGFDGIFYAGELIRGIMYPGTQIAFGHGIYFATPSDSTVKTDAFPNISKIARRYAIGPEGTGFLVRAVIKCPKEIRIAECDTLRQELRENRNRAVKAGITDIGAYAAALGVDAFKADGVYADVPEEDVYVILNRGILLVQTVGLEAPNKK